MHDTSIKIVQQAVAWARMRYETIRVLTIEAKKTCTAGDLTK